MSEDTLRKACGLAHIDGQGIKAITAHVLDELRTQPIEPLNAEAGAKCDLCGRAEAEHVGQTLGDRWRCPKPHAGTREGEGPPERARFYWSAKSGLLSHVDQTTTPGVVYVREDVAEGWRLDRESVAAINERLMTEVTDLKAKLEAMSEVRTSWQERVMRDQFERYEQYKRAEVAEAELADATAELARLRAMLPEPYFPKDRNVYVAKHTGRVLAVFAIERWAKEFSSKTGTVESVRLEPTKEPAR